MIIKTCPGQALDKSTAVTYNARSDRQYPCPGQGWDRAPPVSADACPCSPLSKRGDRAADPDAKTLIATPMPTRNETLMPTDTNDAQAIETRLP